MLDLAKNIITFDVVFYFKSRLNTICIFLKVQKCPQKIFPKTFGY